FFQRISEPLVALRSRAQGNLDWQPRPSSPFGCRSQLAFARLACPGIWKRFKPTGLLSRNSLPYRFVQSQILVLTGSCYGPLWFVPRSQGRASDAQTLETEGSREKEGSHLYRRSAPAAHVRRLQRP